METENAKNALYEAVQDIDLNINIEFQLDHLVANIIECSKNEEREDSINECIELLEELIA